MGSAFFTALAIARCLDLDGVSFAGLAETIPISRACGLYRRIQKIKLGVDSTAKPLAWVLPVDAME